MEPGRVVTLAPPPSKSDAQRAHVLAWMLGLPAPLATPPETWPADLRVLESGLRVLSTGGGTVDCHDGGAPFRFLLAQAAVTPGVTVTFTGTPRLGERPHAPLLEALTGALGPLGLEVTRGTPWPLTVRTPARLGDVPGFRVGGAQSSQFASALALAAARQVARGGAACAVEVEGPLASEGYFELTVSWLARAGFQVERLGHGVRLISSQRPQALPPIPGDWSSLTYLLPIAWRLGAVVAGVARGTGHPDEAFAAHLEAAGLRLRSTPEGTVVEGALARGVTVDARACPDAVPALVALATAAPGPSRFEGTGILRHKESDRVEGVAALARAFGARVEVKEDVLTVTPGVTLGPVRFDPREDHRLAMSAAVAAVLSGAELALTRPGCVAKSFPGFFEALARAGWRLSP